MIVCIRPILETERARFRQRVIETSWNDLSESERSTFTLEQIAPSIHHIIDLLLEQGSNTILVADARGQPNIGQVWLGEATDPYTGQRRGYIYDLYVEAEQQGQGVGRALLLAAEYASRERGDPGLGLTVAAGNSTALALYLSTGFQTERLTLVKSWES